MGDIIFIKEKIMFSCFVTEIHIVEIIFLTFVDRTFQLKNILLCVWKFGGKVKKLLPKKDSIQKLYSFTLCRSTSQKRIHAKTFALI